MPNWLSGQTDTAAFETHVSYIARYIDTPQTGYNDAGTAIFDGSIDWHSSVHAHLATVTEFALSGDTEGLSAFVSDRFAPSDVQQEADANFYDPYGWAWLLKLDTTLRDNGHDDLAPAGDAYAARLESHLQARSNSGSLDYGHGSYNDSFWMISNLHQWAEATGDAGLQARASSLMDDAVADSNLTYRTDIEDGDFFSAAGIATYAHVVTGDTDSAHYQTMLGILTTAAETGEVTSLLASEGAALDSGAGFAHAPGVPISLAYGYWAAFSETGNPVHYAAYEQIMEWAEEHADDLGGTIGTGHWLPNFAAFGLSIPTDLVVPETPELLAALQDFGLDVPPIDDGGDEEDGEGEDTLTGGEGEDTLPGGDDVASYALQGPDAQLFDIDPVTGDIAPKDWFVPDFDDAWDADEDHTYEVTRVALTEDGAEAGQDALEFIVTADGTSWQSADGGSDPSDAGDDGGSDAGDTDNGDGGDGDTGGGSDGGDGPGGDPADGLTYSLEGADAALFTVDSATGAVDTQGWFTASFDDAWDQGEDHTYDVTLIGTDASGAEASRADMQMIVTASGVSWSDGSGDGDDGSDTGGGDTGAGSTFSLGGPDAFLFEIDASTGDVINKSWFVPNAQDAWDQNEDNLYELTVTETGADGAEIGQRDVQFEVNSSNVLVPVLTAQDVASLLFTQELPEDDVVVDEDDLADLVT
jgi:hypothetical protein